MNMHVMLIEVPVFLAVQLSAGDVKSGRELVDINHNLVAMDQAMPAKFESKEKFNEFIIRTVNATSFLGYEAYKAFIKGEWIPSLWNFHSTNFQVFFHSTISCFVHPHYIHAVQTHFIFVSHKFFFRIICLDMELPPPSDTDLTEQQKEKTRILQLEGFKNAWLAFKMLMKAACNNKHFLLGVVL